MLKTNLIGLFLLLSILVSCKDSEKDDLKDAVDNSTGNPTYSAERLNIYIIDPLPPFSTQGVYGTCTFNDDRTQVIYEKEILNYQGTDQCTTLDEACGGAEYRIDFSLLEPILVRSAQEQCE